MNFFYLVSYLITSARGPYDELADYGIFRLLDIAGRLLAIMESQGLSDPFPAELKKMVDEEREGNMDNERQRSRLDAAVLKITQEMQSRYTYD